MAVFEAKDHNQTFNRTKIMCQPQRLESFICNSGWGVEHFALTLLNIISELMRQDGIK